ncbi:MAG: hypothetical protein BAA04_12045 [Firmicutes bacterium ZCTH02-B6]|nr:MAG: hypothetical protein BAA04_12045 [Firmicutes bacterium ZCTH02-B6]
MPEPIRFEDMSTGNRATVLQAVRDMGPISRADLARLTGFSATSVSRIVEELKGQDLVVEAPGNLESGPGRPPTLLSLNDRGWFAVAVNVFPDRVHGGLTDLGGRVLADETLWVTDPAPEAVLALVGRVVEQLRRDAPNPERVVGIGLAVPGVVDARRGEIRYSPPIGWRAVDVPSVLARYTSLPVVLDNWVSARARAERWFGGATGVDEFVYIHASRGIGASVVRSGGIPPRQTFVSTEFGHVVVNPEGPRCRCGRRGCLEAYASADALPRYAGQPDRRPEEILAAARAGDPDARQAVAETLGYLALGIVSLIHMLNPNRMYVDGWPLTDGIDGLAFLRRAVDERVLEGMKEQVSLEPTRLTEWGPLIGGVALVLDAVLSRGEAHVKPVEVRGA